MMDSGIVATKEWTSETKYGNTAGRIELMKYSCSSLQKLVNYI